MALAPTIKLNNGVEIPVVGLGMSNVSSPNQRSALISSFPPAGTWQSKPEDVEKAVEYALKEAGYRHIDCAW